MRSIAECSFCGYEDDVSDSIFPIEPWRFRFYMVKMLERPRYHKVFNYYQGISPRGGKIPLFVFRIKLRVVVKR